MKTPHLFSMTSIIGLFVLVPCMAQEPSRDIADPFGGPGKRNGDSFSNGKDASRSLGSSEVKRADPNRTEPAGDVVALNPEERIRAELNRKTTVRFVATPLSEAVEKLSASHEIPIVIDSRALEEFGLSIKEPVSLAVKNISLRSVLRLLLRDLELSYMIRDEVLVITTVESAEQNLGFRVFPLPASLIGEHDDVIKAVQATIAPDCWQSAGGPSGIFSVKDTLVVTATEPVLGDIGLFLEKVADASEAASSQDARD